MFSQILSILLATSIVACPLLCNAGNVCCSKGSSASGQACCEGCHEADPSSSGNYDPAPVGDQSRTPDDYCHCICGGAVIEDNGLQDLKLHLSNWIIVPVAAQFVAEVIRPQQGNVSWTLLPDDGMNPGRALRCRMMSFLC